MKMVTCAYMWRRKYSSQKKYRGCFKNLSLVLYYLKKIYAGIKELRSV